MNEFEKVLDAEIQRLPKTREPEKIYGVVLNCHYTAK